MTSEKEWGAIPFHKKLRAFPDRHPFVVKCVLGLLFDKCHGVPFDHALAVLRRMGYERAQTFIRVDDSSSLEMQGWSVPE